jgi:hypothetical protein
VAERALRRRSRPTRAKRRAIAKALNADGVPGPDGRPGLDTTICGQAERDTGILNNVLFAGRLVWNRCSYVKDPRSSKRLVRPKPPEPGTAMAAPLIATRGPARISADRSPRDRRPRAGRP